MPQPYRDSLPGRRPNAADAGQWRRAVATEERHRARVRGTLMCVIVLAWLALVLLVAAFSPGAALVILIITALALLIGGPLLWVIRATHGPGPGSYDDD